MTTTFTPTPAADAPSVLWLVYVVTVTGWVEVVDVYAREVTEALGAAEDTLAALGVEWTTAHAEAQR